jgi:DNA-binding response OmpR family regulator
MATEDYGRLKLLFVDDSFHTRTLLREILRGTNWTNAEFVGSAAAAFESIQANRPDLVITDWQMPERSGIDLIQDVREHPDSPDPLLAVILLTAVGSAAHVIGARDAGATGFLVKPISLGRITEGVINAVTKQRPFIVSPGYKGPDWRQPGQTSGGGAQTEATLPAGAIVLPPDGLLLAKVRGDPAAIRAAWQRRADAIAIARRFSKPADPPS